MIGDITPGHYDQILTINQEFVHWLSPLDRDRLQYILSIASYARQIEDARGILIGYPHDANYPDHKNLMWLNRHAENFFYIERVIIDASVQGRGYGRQLYRDVEEFVRSNGYSSLVCDVNTKPDNPGSHGFHLALGFKVMGEEDYPQYDVSLRYYEKKLS